MPELIDALYGRFVESKHKEAILQSFAYRMQGPFDAYMKEDPITLKFIGATFHLRLLCYEITCLWYKICDVETGKEWLNDYDPPNEERQVIKQVLQKEQWAPGICRLDLLRQALLPTEKLTGEVINALCVAVANCTQEPRVVKDYATMPYGWESYQKGRSYFRKPISLPSFTDPIYEKKGIAKKNVPLQFAQYNPTTLLNAVKNKYWVDDLEKLTEVMSDLQVQWSDTWEQIVTILKEDPYKISAEIVDHCPGRLEWKLRKLLLIIRLEGDQNSERALTTKTELIDLCSCASAEEVKALSSIFIDDWNWMQRQIPANFWNQLTALLNEKSSGLVLNQISFVEELNEKDRKLLLIASQLKDEASRQAFADLYAQKDADSLRRIRASLHHHPDKTLPLEAFATFFPEEIVKWMKDTPSTAFVLYGPYKKETHEVSVLQSYCYRINASFNVYANTANPASPSPKLMSALYHIRMLHEEIRDVWGNPNDDWYSRLQAVESEMVESDLIRGVQDTAENAYGFDNEAIFRTQAEGGPYSRIEWDQDRHSMKYQTLLELVASAGQEADAVKKFIQSCSFC